MTALYKNTRAKRVRFLHLGSWAAALATLALLAAPARAGDGEAVTLMAVFASLLAGFALVMELYLRCYVTEIADKPDGLSIRTLSTLGERTLRVGAGDLVVGAERRDVARTGFAPSVDNKYVLVRIPKSWLPLIVDTTTDALDLATLRRLARRPATSARPSKGRVTGDEARR